MPFGASRAGLMSTRVDAIPDSVVAHYDATEEETIGSISSIDDLVGSFDLSGNCEVISSGINDQQTYRFDGSEDMRIESTGMATTEPWGVVFVVEPQESVNSNSFWIEFNADSAGSGIQDDDGGTFDIHRENVDMNGDTPSSEPQILTYKAYDADRVEFRVDGETQADDSLAGGDMNGIMLANAFHFDEPAEIDIGEVYALEGAEDDDFGQLEESLSDDWQISL